MKKRQNKTILDTRLTELDKQIADLDSRIGSLSREARKRGEDVPAAGRAAAVVRRQHREAPPVAEEPAAPAAAGPAPREPAGWMEEAAPLSPQPRRQDERFGRLFMSGNLGPSGAQLRRERRLQRNRAIVMLIVVFVVLLGLLKFIVFR